MLETQANDRCTLTNLSLRFGVSVISYLAHSDRLDKAKPNRPLYRLGF